jgi:hypothetical protein
MAGGLFFALKPNWIMNITGPIQWVERRVFKLYGGTSIFYRVVGLVLILVSIVIAFGRIRLGFLEQFFPVSGT